MKPLTDLTEGQLLSRERLVDKRRSDLCEILIDEGRGHESYSATAKRYDATSVAYIKSSDERAEIAAEKTRRMTYHGSLKRIIVKPL